MMTNLETIEKRELQDAFDAGICFAMLSLNNKTGENASEGFIKWIEGARKDLVSGKPK